MKVTLIVLGILLAVILVLLALRVGVLAEYADTGPLVRVWAGPVRLTLIPRPNKKHAKKKKSEKKPEKKKKEKKSNRKTEHEPEKQEKRGGSLQKLLDMLPLLLDALGNLCRRIRIEHLRVHYTIAGQPDPANAALWYGRLQLGGGAVCQLLEEHIQVRERDVTVDVDFFTEEMSVYASAACSLRVGQILAVAFRFLWQYWKQIRQRKRAAQEG